ncbi:MAG TPA: Holliday junction resolvase RuvX [Candidatus Subteraquimicrobiales bacterium]
MNKRKLGLDVGSKYLGVAISDPLGQTASNLTTIIRGKFSDEVSHIKKIVREYKIGEIVVGMPFNMNGTKGPQAQEVDEYLAALKKEFSIAINSWDERLTTLSAKSFLRGKHDLLTHQVAAAIMLQNYLDRQRHR